MISQFWVHHCCLFRLNDVEVTPIAEEYQGLLQPGGSLDKITSPVLPPNGKDGLLSFLGLKRGVPASFGYEMFLDFQFVLDSVRGASSSNSTSAGLTLPPLFPSADLL